MDVNVGCLDSWIEFLEQPNNCKIDLTIDRVLRVAKELKLTTFNCPVVNVAGTNGKGSCVASLEAISRTLDKKVGVFTSPHMHCIRERIRIDGKNISSQELCDSLASVYRAANDIDVYLTYFEYITLAALNIFREANLDLVVLEVGLGGRLDAVNVVENSIAIVTSIAKDHCSFLGDTLEKIAAEKAGIFKKGGWAIFNEFESTSSVLKEKAKGQSSKLCLFGKDFSINEGGDSWSWTNSSSSFFNIPSVDFPVQNAALALAAAYILYGNQISSSVLHKAFANLSVAGRYNNVTINGKRFIFDVAHNPAGSDWLLQKVISNRPKNLRVIFQPLVRKDWLPMLKSWDRYVHKWYFIDEVSEEIVLPEELMSSLERENFEVMKNHVEALEVSSSEAIDDDIVVVFGSFHIVSTCLKEYESLVA